MLGMYLRVFRSRVMKPALLSECRSTEELDCGIDNALEISVTVSGCRWIAKSSMISKARVADLTL
jgi:hypothetical protein